MAIHFEQVRPFHGYDNTVRPNWLMVPQGLPKTEARVADGRDYTLTSLHPQIARVTKLAGDLVHVQGVHSHSGPTQIEARDRSGRVATLNVTVLPFLAHHLWFHWVIDRDGRHSQRQRADLERMVGHANGVFQPQVNMTFDFNASDLDVSPRRLGTLTPSGLRVMSEGFETLKQEIMRRGSHRNDVFADIFLVRNYEQPGIYNEGAATDSSVHGGRRRYFVILRDLPALGGLALAHELGHCLLWERTALGTSSIYGGGYNGDATHSPFQLDLMFPFLSSSNRRIRRVEAEVMNPGGSSRVSWLGP